MQKFNYHGHTKRCGHAIGEDEEYVKQAISNGYTHIGFSDHAPYVNGYIKGERMHLKELQQYIESIQRLQKKYQDQIDIRIGLEFEMYESQLEQIKKYKETFDYLIVGQHEPELFEEGIYTKYDDESVLRYAKLICKACELGLPNIIAHPDLFMYDKKEFNEACIKATHMICESAVQYGIPLELNLNGLKYGKAQLGSEYRYRYPYRGFWEIAQNYPIKVIFGLDAHTPDKYADQKCYEIVMNEIVNDLNLTFIKDFRIPKKEVL